MNKAQDILERIKRFQFWILCGLVSVVGIVSWWLATSSLADTYTKSKTKIESEAGKIGVVKGIEPHPNQKWNVVIGGQVEGAKKKVADAWQRLYSEQEAKVFIWPENVFGERFVAAAKPLAATLRAKQDPGGDLTADHRRLYQNNVLEQFKEFAKLLDAEYVDSKESTGSFGGERYGAAAATADLQPGQIARKVTWTGQDTLQQPYMWQKEPDTLAVLYAQEEIWVIKALCNAIAKANKDSTGAHDAAVRAILAMSVGYEAAEEHPGGMGELGRITKVTAPTVATGGGYGSTGGGYGSTEGGSSGGYGSPSSEAGPGAGGGGMQRPARLDRKSTGGQSGYGGVGESATTAVASDDPKQYLNEWRYVQGDGRPLSAAELATPPFYEYRLMPWRVTMTVDQRKWDELLVMFRNTELPLEIRQVRVNPVLDASSSGGYGGRYGSSEGGSSGGGYGSTSKSGGYGSTSLGGRYGASDGGLGVFGLGVPPVQETVTLELRGFAYLLNPPDPANIGKVGTTTPLDSGAAAPAMDTTAAAPATDPANPFGGPPIQPAAPAGPPPGAGGGR
jgi:hypothetical protein